MRVRNTVAPAIALMATTALLLTGCGDAKDGHATAQNKEAVSGDESGAKPAGNMDPGKYRTTPLPAFSDIGDPMVGRAVEGQRMAEFVTLPVEIDGQLTEMSGGVSPIQSGHTLGTILADGAGDIADRDGLLAGFKTIRHSVGDPKQARGLVHAVLRFRDAAGAQKAAQDLHDNVLKPTAIVPDTPDSIKVLPNSLVSVGESRGRFASNTFTPHGMYVIYDWAETVPADKEWAAKTTATAVNLQGPLIDKFPATPEDQFDKVKVDIDSVLVNAVPEKAADRNTYQLAVYGVRGAAHFANDSEQNLKDFADTGTTHEAIDATSVYKSDSEKGSKELMNRFINESLANKAVGWKAIPGPAGVPGAKCLTGKSQGIAPQPVFYCMVQKGKFAAEISGIDSKDTMQKATAQYMILDNAQK